MLRRELKFYWIALSADFAYMLFVFTVTRLMAENQASLLALGVLGAASSLGYGLGAPIGGRVCDLWGEQGTLLNNGKYKAVRFWNALCAASRTRYRLV